jgi:hypothetical protein
MWADLSVVYEDLDCKDNHARRCHLLATARHRTFRFLAPETHQPFELELNFLHLLMRVRVRVYSGL